MDLGSEHERYLAEEVFKGPIIVYNYPKDIKAFYMRLNDDGKTVAAMDILVPKVRCMWAVLRGGARLLPLSLPTLRPPPFSVCVCVGSGCRPGLSLCLYLPPMPRGSRWASWWAARSVKSAWTCWSSVWTT